MSMMNHCTLSLTYSGDNAYHPPIVARNASAPASVAAIAGTYSYLCTACLLDGMERVRSMWLAAFLTMSGARDMSLGTFLVGLLRAACCLVARCLMAVTHWNEKNKYGRQLKFIMVAQFSLPAAFSANLRSCSALGQQIRRRMWILSAVFRP